MSESETERIAELERAGKLIVTRHNVPQQISPNLSLTNPLTHARVRFYPATGIIVRANVRQFRQGLDAALKLIGVMERVA